MKYPVLLSLLVLPVLGMPRFMQPEYGGGMDPGFQSSYFPSSPYGGNLMARDDPGWAMRSNMYSDPPQRDYGYRLRSPSAYGQPRSYGSYGGYEQLPTRYGYGAQERGMYDPTARYISGTGEGGYMPGDNPQFMGDNHYMGGEGSRFMGGEGSGMMSAGSGMMGGGSGMMGGGGFMGASQFAGEGGPGGGDGLEDMFKMQAEMQQMQRQMMRGPPAVAKDKGNTTTNAVRIGENILVTNQTRYTDSNDGLSQGFFQEFQIFPGSETTTQPAARAAVAGSGEKPVIISSILHDAVPLPTPIPAPGATDSSKKLAAVPIPPETVFGFAPSDNFFNPGKLGDLPDIKSRETNLILPIKDSAYGSHKPVKKAFSPEKFEVLGENFQRAFDAL